MQKILNNILFFKKNGPQKIKPVSTLVSTFNVSIKKKRERKKKEKKKNCMHDTKLFFPL